MNASDYDSKELRTAAERAKANLAAMTLAAELARAPRPISAAERAVLMAYSGWGGLSIEKNLDKFPRDFPHPEREDVALIHEYYTPPQLCAEIARVCKPLLPGLASDDGRVLAVEPSAGIGRFLDAFSGPGFELLDWHAVELSPVSAALQRAAFPGIHHFHGPFERWVAEHEADASGRVKLVIANPPYGARDASKTEDANRAYRQSRDKTDSAAYAYFLRRGLDLLGAGGLGVYVIPSGFMTGASKDHEALRRAVLLRHHIAAAYRLPSGLFAGATGSSDPGKVSTAKFTLNIDVIFFRSRGGMLSEVDEADRFILAGNYFDTFPQHILGREIGGQHGHAHYAPRGEKSDQPPYQVIGVFERLPDLDERPMCSACAVTAVPAPAPRRVAAPAAPSPALRQEHWLAGAASLGRRVRGFLADVARQDLEVPAMAWEELHTALTDWARKYGPPSLQVDLVRVAKSNDDLQQLLSVFERGTTKLIRALRTKPVWEPRYRGRADDVLALATWTFRQHRRLGLGDLAGLDIAPLFAAGWAEDDGQLYPPEVYYYGDLWPKYDRAKARAERGDTQADAQARKLLDAIKPALFDDIGGVSPRQGWIPLSLVSEWLAPKAVNKAPPPLVRNRGVVEVHGKSYEDTDRLEGESVGLELQSVLGWINHDKDQFRPRTPEKKFVAGDFVKVQLDVADPESPKLVGKIVKIARTSGAKLDTANIDKDGDAVFEVAIEDQPNMRVYAAAIIPLTLDEMRLAIGAEWERAFRDWCASDPDRRDLVETTYQRTFQGFRAPPFDPDPLPVARWIKDGRKLHGYQSAALKRLLANRGGLLAFDVGLGKTYTGLAAVARARQEGWSRRPIVVVPNSIVWKWVADFRTVLPDYRVGVIGSKKKQITRGSRAGKMTSETDTSSERATTWARFQAGEFDVVLVTYSALPRTRMDDQSLKGYVEKTAAIQRQMLLKRRNVKKKARAGKDLSEREGAVLKAGVSAWVAEMLELPPGWKFDGGVTWDEVGVDLLVVDEAQNYKNLYLPEAQEGGVPKFMGNPGAGSGRAWQLDFRTSTVRRRSGGAGVMLLSATPAKNSPLEFYNLIQYVDHQAWEKLGITDPQQFIDRYCKIELRDIINTAGEVEQRGAVVGFQNLDELRGIVFRYADFKTAQQVGLKIPEGRPEQIKVDLDDRQERKFVEYLDTIKLMRKNPALGNPLGLLARLNLIAIHPDLESFYDDERRLARYGWKDAPGAPERKELDGTIIPAVPRTIDARRAPNPHSPKLDAVAREVVRQRGCGHIAFCDNVAVHVWLQKVLVDAGIPAERIAILNAEAVKAVDDRLQVAQDFNGVPPMINGVPVPESKLAEAGPDDVITEPVEPKYDVVIANAVAYEGMDLQTRTCQVHHLDLPYEPATLQQRNGRAVRQGNTIGELPIKYYLANKSLDGFRFGLIAGKLGWMDALIAGTARSTNNPAAQEQISLEDALIELSRDPEEERALRAEQAARRLEETRRKIAKASSATLRAAAGRFALARQESDPGRAASLRADAEKLLDQIASVQRGAWPWLPWAEHARTHGMLVPIGGQAPVYEGLRVSYPNPVDPDELQYTEFGKTDGQTIGVRGAGSAIWQAFKEADVNKLELRPDSVTSSWPAEEERVLSSLRNKIHGLYQGPKAWTELGWHLATDAFVDFWWAKAGNEVIRRMRGFDGTNRFPVPVLFGDVVGFGLQPREGVEPTHIFPPTEVGWNDFLARATAGDKLKGSPMRSDVFELGRWWWGRPVPRDLFRAAEFAEAMTALHRALGALAVAPQDERAKVDVILAAIDASLRGAIEDAVMRAVAEVLTQLDDALVTKDAPTWRVKGLIALRGQAKSVTGRAPVSAREAPTSARSVAADSARSSARPPLSARPSVLAPFSRSGGSADSSRSGTMVQQADSAMQATPNRKPPKARATPVSAPRPAPPPTPDDELMSALELEPAPEATIELDGEEELMSALELDPELEAALELDGEEELMSALELDPELEAALELDAVG